MLKIKFDYSFAHMQRDCYPVHGPRDLSWFKPIAFSFCKLTLHSPSTGYRLWVISEAAQLAILTYFSIVGTNLMRIYNGSDQVEICETIRS